MSDEVIIQDAEYKTSYHVQVRLYRSGPKKADKRRGDIILEDREAPPEVARWLQSAKCCRGGKSTLKGGVVDIWVDATPVGDHSIEVPDADTPQEEEPARPLPAVQDTASLRMAEEHTKRINRWIDALEEDLRQARERHREEVNRIREDRDKEVQAAEEAIESARLRLQLVLTREDEELAMLQARRSKLNEERAKLSEDLSRDQETYREIKEGLAASLNAPNVIESATKALENPAVVQVLGMVLDKLGTRS